MITGTITQIVPDSQYQETVHTQTVTVRLDDTPIELFDDTVPVATDELLGETVPLQIRAQPNAIERSPHSSLGITKRQTDDYQIVGSIRTVETHTDGSESSIILDVGCGTITIEPVPDIIDWLENEQVGSGETVSVTAYRLDLDNITSQS